MKRFTRLFLPLLLCVFFGTVFYMVSSGEAKDYPSVFLNPPSFVFPIAWTIIYLLLGISFYLYKKNTQRKDWFIDFTYYTNLVINALWSIIFFVLKWRLVAVIWIIILLLNLISLISLFLKKNPPSAYLNIIYLLWTIFATYLTIGIYILN